MPNAEPAHGATRVFTVPLGTDFSEATVRFILSNCGDDPLAITRMTLLLPNNRAIKAMTEAFVRTVSPGLLLPKMVAIGDLALDEALGPILDPLSDDDVVWPVISPTNRILLLAELVVKNRPLGQSVSAAESLRLARKLAEMIDELEIEQIDFERLKALEGVTDLSEHWRSAYGQISAILPAYREELANRKLLGPAERRNLLLGRLEQRLRENPPTSPLIAAGITTSAIAVSNLLRRIARLPNGSVILPGVDLNMPEADWDALRPPKSEDGVSKPSRNAEVHPQFHLRLLLDRMAIARDEVAPVSSGAAPAMADSITDIFCLPERSTHWRALPANRKKLAHVRLIEADDSAQEAKIIAVHIRQRLEQAGQRTALITPDREIAARVASQLRRWGISVDDSAGKPLLQSPEGTLFLGLANAVARRFSATDILEIAKHPLVHMNMDRLEWLNQARALDSRLRGPSVGVGIFAFADEIAKAKDDALNLWWTAYSGQLTLLDNGAKGGLVAALDAMKMVADTLTAGQIWKGAAGRELARVLDELGACNLSAISLDDSSALPAIVTELLSGAVVRPPYGGHPRVAIYGLLEARLQQADLVICAGLNETIWPQIAQPDPWLAPAIRRHLGLATLDRNIGLSAHDLATALGAKDVVLTRARRDRGGPGVASRFLLRMRAYLGNSLQIDETTPRLAALLDEVRTKLDFAPRPKPMPTAEQRRVGISVTDFDQLKSDPYSFYAKRVLRLRPMEPVDAEPDHKWRGILVHDILEKWFRDDNCAPEKLIARAEDLLTNGALDPILRTLWQPRIADGLRWIANETQRLRDEDGRRLLIAEEKGSFELSGITITGRADRIDAAADGSLIIMDYKTGGSPKPKQIYAGYALQLGLIGLMAERGAIKGVRGDALGFEYWSLGKDQKRGAFGYIAHATAPKASDKRKAADEFVGFITKQAEDALNLWILGAEPFTAKLHPEFSNYADYDHLMRLQEWDGRQSIAEASGA
jgi:ATP-dependent helicase/nuclease subunit B